jgi:Holliday junction resolvase RusA-like endonuclease
MIEPLGKFSFNIDLATTVVRCQIPGEPQAWQRVGWAKRGHAYNPKANELAGKNIRDYLTLAAPFLGTRAKYDAVNRFGVIFLFATNVWDTDLDNYTKLVFDAVKKFVWKDDRQVDEAYIRCARGVNIPARSELTFYTLETTWG